MIQYHPNRFIGSATRMTFATSSSIQASNQKVAFSFLAQESRIWTALDAYLVKTASPVTTLRYRIQTDASNLPSGTDVANGIGPEFTPPGSTGWSGPQSFPAGGPSLVFGTRYWMVLEPVTVTTLSGTNFWGWNQMIEDGTRLPAQSELSTFNGTSWVAATTGRAPSFVATTDAGTWGNGYTGQTAISMPGAGGTTRTGSKFHLDATTAIDRVYFSLSVFGAPGSVELKIFDTGNTQWGATVTIPLLGLWPGGASQNSNSATEIKLPAVVILSPGDYWIQVSATSGDNVANLYQANCLAFTHSDSTVRRNGGADLVGSRTSDTAAWSILSGADLMYVGVGAAQQYTPLNVGAAVRTGR